MGRRTRYSARAASIKKMAQRFAQVSMSSDIAENSSSKCLGLLGGLNPEASAVYTRFLHQAVRELRGQSYAAILRTAYLNQNEISECCANGDWDRIGQELETAARSLVQAGAKALLFDSSLFHISAERVERAAGVPLLHAFAACERALKADGIACVGLLGTRCVEEEELWREWLRVPSGIDIALPPTADRKLVADIMQHELAFGRIKEASRVTMIRTMKALKRAGARGIVVVAPELLPLALPSDTSLKFYGAAKLHTRAAVEWALAAVPLKA